MASLKTAERQAEDQRQKLYLTEIDLATERQLVRDLKAELQKTKDCRDTILVTKPKMCGILAQ